MTTAVEANQTLPLGPENSHSIATHYVAPQVYASTMTMIGHFDTPYSRQIALWVLRLFSTASAAQLFIRDENYADRDIALFLELPMNSDPGGFAEVPKIMAAMLTELESCKNVELDATARENLDLFSRAFGLNVVEDSILKFFILAEIDAVLIDSLRVAYPLAKKPERLLAKVLKIGEKEIRDALRKGSRLRSGGLLRMGSNRLGKIPNLEFFSSDVARSLIHDEFDLSRILSVMGVMESDAPLLGTEDYPHLVPGLFLLLEYLRNVTSNGKPGVNILLYGEPGTGKTQLTRVIAHELGLPLFDFAVCDSDGDPIDAMKRLTFARVAESFLRDRDVLFVFDEFEDILTPSGTARGLVNESKGWFNRFLESNVRPIFWLSNSIRHLDPAFARRFDFIIEVPVPPRSRREQIIRNHVGHHLSGKTIRRLAEIQELAPAVVTRVSEIFNKVSETLPKIQRDEAFSQMINMTLKAQGHSLPSQESEDILPTDVYDTACLNADANLPELARMLRDHPHARICLHGPPGTGKTAFGHWLSLAMDRPLHVKRVSDLLSPYVGGTEMEIAATFEKALSDDAILLIDEVDSFLQDRTKAVRSWEITQVNELLTRMEAFNGVFIATTNRLEHLDAASLRRFDLKLHFGYLAPHQIFELLVAWSRRLGIAPTTGDDSRMIETLECVTPGDFAAVARRHRFQPFADAYGFLRAIHEECAMKSENARRIGFQ